MFPARNNENKGAIITNARSALGLPMMSITGKTSGAKQWRQ
jgi:hypothetical protein